MYSKPHLTRSSRETKNGSSYLGVRVNRGRVFLDILLGKIIYYSTISILNTLNYSITVDLASFNQNEVIKLTAIIITNI